MGFYYEIISFKIRFNLNYISRQSLQWLWNKKNKKKQKKKLFVKKKQTTLTYFLSMFLLRIYNGKRWKRKNISPWALGYKIGSFIFTRKFAMYKALQRRKLKLKEAKKRANILKGLKHKHRNDKSFDFEAELDKRFKATIVDSPKKIKKKKRVPLNVRIYLKEAKKYINERKKKTKPDLLHLPIVKRTSHF